MFDKLKLFTLLELLIALSIISIIAYISASSFISIRKATEWSGKNSEIRKDVNSLIENLNNEISSVIYISSNERTRFRSRRIQESDVKINDLRFCYIDPIGFYELNKRDELVEVEYKIEKNNNFENKYKVEKRIWYLARYPDRWEQRDPDVSYVLLENADFFKMDFYSKGKWYDSWDTKKQKSLPDMIEVDFMVNGKEYREYFNVYISEF